MFDDTNKHLVLLYGVSDLKFVFCGSSLIPQILQGILV